MKSRSFLRSTAVVAFVCLLGWLCVGCETVRGMGRDIKNADEWLRERAW